jgi:hypothetical protein
MIKYFRPKVWVIENPNSGLLKTRDVIANIPYAIGSYCHYGDLGWQKTTRFWTNLASDSAKVRNGYDKIELKKCKFDCENLDDAGKRHKFRLGGDHWLKPKGCNSWLMCQIPSQLLNEFFKPIVKPNGSNDERRHSHAPTLQ